MAYCSLHRPLSAGATVCHTSLPRPTLPSRRLFIFLPLQQRRRRAESSNLVARARGRENPGTQQSDSPKESSRSPAATHSSREEAEEEEVDEDLPWIQEKALDLVEFTGTVTQAIPGPKVGQSKLPWLLAVPLAWVGLSFVIGFVKALRKFTSPRAQRKRLVRLRSCITFGSGTFWLVFPLHCFKKVFYCSYTCLSLPGPVVMDLSGFTEKGFKRKLAVQALFGKNFYLSEVCYS
ncbi:hypothetical protein BHE74_00038106 [Ensete ventricosum]|nr:hypothetical protein BHE74_00038106 [Ensete ventricosum]